MILAENTEREGWLVRVVDHGDMKRDDDGALCKSLTVKIVKLGEDGLPKHTWGMWDLVPQSRNSQQALDDTVAILMLRGLSFIEGYLAATNESMKLAEAP